MDLKRYMTCFATKQAFVAVENSLQKCVCFKLPLFESSLPSKTEKVLKRHIILVQPCHNSKFGLVLSFRNFDLISAVTVVKVRFGKFKYDF